MNAAPEPTETDNLAGETAEAIAPTEEPETTGEQPPE